MAFKLIILAASLAFASASVIGGPALSGLVSGPVLSSPVVAAYTPQHIGDSLVASQALPVGPAVSSYVASDVSALNAHAVSSYGLPLTYSVGASVPVIANSPLVSSVAAW